MSILSQEGKKLDTSILYFDQKEDGSIHYELELFFQDTEDTFAGHFLYADIEDHEVKEITLMG